MARLNECILYRNFEHGEILDKMAELMNAWEQKAPDLKDKEGMFFECANGLVEMAGSYGFSGNLWHCYLTFLLVNNENAFSTACEIRGAVNGSINELALNDFGVFKELYDFDLTVLDEAFGILCCKILKDYTNTGSNSKMFNSRIRDRICDLSQTLAAAETTEEFMKDITWLDMLKLKGSWGTLGNQNMDKAYPAEPLLENAFAAVFGKPAIIYPGYQLAYLPNPRLRWEKVEAWETGFETNMFRNRFHFEGVYYKKNTKDLLATVPGLSGTVPGIGNLGEIENKGVELMASWRDQIGDWGYSVSANLTTISNKVKSLVQDGYSIIAGDKSQSYTMAGYPIGYFYGYKVAGVYQNQAEIDASPVNTLATVTPGDLKFADVNGDGKITPDDRTKIGDPTPDVTYGISLGLSYKNWELSMEMMGQGGNQIYRTWDNYNWAQFNYMEQRLDRWHGEGTSNTQPLLNTKHAINSENSEYFIEDGSFFRIRNLQLAYSFDKTLLSKIRMQALKVYVNIQNLKTWKHNTGYTPEIGGSAIAFGVDNGTYPVPAVYTFGINLTF